MPRVLARFILTALALALPLAARAEPLPRKESNVSIRNEVQLAIDKGLAHLQSTQRTDGTWGKLGTTGFVLMAFQRDPRGGGKFEAVMDKGAAALRQALAPERDLEKMHEFAWNVPPAVLALSQSRDPGDAALVTRARQAIGAAPLPAAPETRALFLALDPKHRAPGPAPLPLTGSAVSAWLWMVNRHDAKPNSRAAHETSAWLSEHYTLERNPAGEGVHQYYFWLSSIFGPKQDGWLSPELKLSSGETVDIPRHLAEKLINEQNGSGSWRGLGEHWTEKDPDLVTAMCVLTLEQVYGQL
jgi:hypothetical protein